MLIRRMPHAAVAIAMLLLFAATAWAESSGGPVRRREWRERTRGEGVDGLTMLRFHAGLSSPSGNLSDGFETGWGVGVSLAHGVSPSVLISTAVALHQFDAEGGSGEMTIIPWTFNVDAVIPTDGRVRPWVGGGLGIYNEDLDFSASAPGFGFSVSDTNLGLNMGMGVGGPLGPRTLWGAGFRYHHIFEGDTFNDLSFLTFQFGFGFAL